ncbi:GPI inositol-deacylase-like [Mya arenaria]|uniref:GPI inositol-deacylase-like n=1 Tax=Mya arenaria TaxID=6604 RepID=UPI0022E4A676|nr:GPI inositol-deacylase-like [Mya arenaria]
MASVKPVIGSVLMIFLVVLGILDVITNIEENKCEMTWMYEMPQYLPVEMPKKVREKYPHYGLYVYGEGQYANMLRSMKMTGIPVLFIPGNAGSYKQVRSLASVAFRRAVDKNKLYHFNFFSVDLNEEYSGLYGDCLQYQTEYVREAIKKILGLYKYAQVQPKTIILVGHSMGGMVARGLFTLPKFDANLVNTIYMQATPNQAPVVVTDPALLAYYEKVNTYWGTHGNTTLRHITLVSSGGGEYDVQVRGGLTQLDGVTPSERSISTSTTHLPKAWVSTDHRCIVWCKQVVLAFVRSMFDIVHEKKHMVSEDIDYRMHVFRHHFLQNAGSIGHVTHWPESIDLSAGGWTLLGDRLFRWSRDKVEEETYLAVPLIEFEDADHVVVTSNSPRDSWVCVCELKEGEKQCSSCKDISSTGNVIPPLYSNKKVVHVDLNSDEMARITHIVIVIPKTEKKVEVLGELYTQDQRHLSNSVPGLLEVAMSYPESVVKGTLILDLGSKATFYKLKLYNMNSVVKAYTATLETSKCTNQAPDEHAGSVMKFHVPWSNDDAYRYAKYGERGNITMRLHTIPPDPVVDPRSLEFSFEALSVANDYVELSLYLDPTCSHQIRLTMSFKQMLGQFVRFYGILMPVFCVAVLLMSLVHQLRTVATDGYCPSVLNSIWQIKPYFVVPAVLLIQFLLQLKVVEGTLGPLGVPAPDIQGLDRQGIMFRGAPVLFYMTASAITTFQAGVIQIIIQFKSRLLGLVFGWLPVSVTSLLDKVLLLICIAAVGLAITVSGALAIFICYVVAFIQLLRLCYSERQSSDPSVRSRYHFQQTLFMLWLWLLMLNAPPLVVFGKATLASGSVSLFQRDPSGLVGSAAAIIFLSIISTNTPQNARSLSRGVSYVIHILVIGMVTFSMVVLYRITYTVLAALGVLAATQVYGALTARQAPRPKTE